MCMVIFLRIGVFELSNSAKPDHRYWKETRLECSRQSADRLPRNIHNESRYSARSSICCGVSCEVLPCSSFGLRVVSTSRMVAAEPSCRYGDVRQSSHSVGVSNSLSSLSKGFCVPTL